MNLRPIANENQQVRLYLFARALSELCNKFEVDLSPRGCADIEVVCRDDDRPEHVREQWPVFAWISGVDQSGVYSRVNLEDRRAESLKICCYASDFDPDAPPSEKAGQS